MMNTSYDPETLAFLADQSQCATGKKHYNPMFRSRIPSTRPLPRRTPSTPATPHSAPAALPTDPIYLLSVLGGQELATADALTRWSQLTHTGPALQTIVPTNFHNEPMLPGSIFVAIPDTLHYLVRQQIRTMHWGFLSADPVDPETVKPFLPYQQDANAEHGAAFPPSHPVRVIADAIAFSRGWHGSLQGSGWALHDAHGQPIVSPQFTAFWDDLVAAWSRRDALETIITRHRPMMEHVAYPLTLTDTSRADWQAQWLERPAVIPAAEHRQIRLKRPKAEVWGVLTDTHPLTFSLCHPTLAAHRLRYRVAYQDLVRVPGNWAVILVPQATATVRMHVRQTAQSLGWTESWLAVDAVDPAGIIAGLLKPQAVQYDRTAHRIRLQGIPSERLPWLAKAAEWLPDWMLV